MGTIIEDARDGWIPHHLIAAAEREGLDPEALIQNIANGSAIVMAGEKRAVGIGRGFSAKVNVNIGTSTVRSDLATEVAKAAVAERYGADTLTDLSMGGDIREIRAAILSETELPLTTVPIYQAVVDCGGIDCLDADMIIDTLRRQAAEGVSSFVLHMTDKKTLEALRRSQRVLGVVSKGGSMTAGYMLHTGCKNPFLEYFDEVMEIARKHEIVISLGNTMRGGSIVDGGDAAAAVERKQNIDIADCCHEHGVQVIVEGCGGHVRIDRIPLCVRLYKDAAPYPLFVAGPLATDRAVGHDEIAGAIGASVAVSAGADYLCAITPAEHIGLPTEEEVRQGLIAFKIAAHIGDTVRFGSDEADATLSSCRAELDWKGQIEAAIDPDGLSARVPDAGPCSMCGDYCAIKIMREYLSRSD
ncbi:phosphomethylpyrimidine synthase ThiC [Methanocalculus taiwanensis]|uniref:Phosphomethylpyrimidine synthase ThiC n=1 Tax=Methanocalculus taiwanensis TaxID=106207 RepID=A0ABD4TGT3_9EURY|nr:phosphomethylpyrimidine synthase ThiC [Methanocalculus taiwanensis]MCQ1537497.1 phosphomethylpyrimidine synthase ThiC [Methanocalculus taiwanensis]